MRLSRFLLQTLLGTLFTTCSVVAATEPEWILNNGSDNVKVAVGEGGLHQEFGLTRIDSFGTDCTLTLPMSKDDAFDSSSRPFFAFRYRYQSQQKFAGLFFTTDKLEKLSDKSYSQFDVISDGEWHNKVVDMRTFEHKNWNGTIRQIRLDPTNPSAPGDKYEISRLGFFATAEDAESFLSSARDEPDFSQPSSFVGDNYRCFIPGGALDASFNRGDYCLSNENSPKTFKLKNRRESVVVTNGDKIEPLCDATSRGYATYCVRSKGSYKLVDLGEQPTPQDVEGRSSESAVMFVLARNLMDAKDGAFRPKDKLSAEETTKLQNALNQIRGYGEIGAQVAETGTKLSDLTREETAVLLMNAIRSALGTAVESPYSHEYFTRDRLRIGAWGNFNPNDYDSDYMRTYADCGFDFLLAMGEIPSAQLLADGDKFGVEIFVNDGQYANPLIGDASYVDHPSYAGAFVTDEPGTDNYDKLAKICNPYKELTGKEAYINLLPMYANAAQLKYGAGAAAIEYYDSDPDLFRKYCAEFCKKFDTKYICTDIYPLNWNSRHEKATYADYVESINIIASVAREYNREFWCYIQTFGWIPSKRTPTEAEYRWQCYSMLSFGCRCILCWTYAGYKKDFPSLVDVHSQKTTAWHDFRPVAWELRRLSDEYVKYQNIGAFTHNCSDKTPYLKMSNEYKEFKTIQSLQCDQPLLIGVFEKNDESRSAAFTLVNMSELQANAGAEVNARLDAMEVVAWYRGVPQHVVPDANGVYTFNLASGEGVFVTTR